MDLYEAITSLIIAKGLEDFWQDKSRHPIYRKWSKKDRRMVKKFLNAIQEKEDWDQLSIPEAQAWVRNTFK